ncbi:MAG TPA: hypothetical protein VGR28_07040 [Candidatus Thermoplasmatota archaeon]|jgi:hypothetical protein|nr:hypothetical protein [Candidatus Thermoplasmatota archaeon]
MDRRSLAALGLAAAGLSQAGYGALMGGASFFALISFAEGGGLLVAAVGVARAPRLPGTWVVAGLTLAAVASLPWFTRVAGFASLGPVASLAGNTGSVIAAGAVIAWTLARASEAAGFQALRLGLALQALGGLVWVTVDAGQSSWTLAYALAFAGFGAAAAALPPPPVPAFPAAQPSAAAARAAGKAP